MRGRFVVALPLIWLACSPPLSPQAGRGKKQDVDARHKAGHDDGEPQHPAYLPALPMHIAPAHNRHPMLPAAENSPPIPTVRELFVAFALAGLSGFGGVLPFARRMMVEQRGG